MGRLEQANAASLELTKYVRESQLTTLHSLPSKLVMAINTKY